MLKVTLQLRPVLAFYNVTTVKAIHISTKSPGKFVTSTDIMADVAKMKSLACESIDRASAELNEVSQSLWKNPELGYEEKHAHTVLTDSLKGHSFNVEKHYVLDTAFRASFGSDNGPNVGLICEYDALPEIGHACGHNLIAEVGLGAGIGVRAAVEAAEKAGLKAGKVTVLGTPAEEGCLGGKIDLINAGAFSDIDCAMTAHPFPYDIPRPLKFALRILNVKFLGRASHAAGFPWEGVNALDAAVAAYQSVSNMRQQMKPSWRIHGIIINGGSKPNIIPEESTMEFYIRAPTMAELETLSDKAKACFQGAAMTTGCEVEFDWHDKIYANMVHNSTLADRYEQNATHIGMKFESDQEKVTSPSGSTDMGNVSLVVPSIHPMYYIGGIAANHSPKFCTLSGHEDAQLYTLNQAKALAMTAIDVLYTPEIYESMKENHQQLQST